MSNPNWADLTVLKSKMYLDLSSVDADRDAALELLGEHVTARIILSLNNSSIDDTEPPIPLNQACLRQCCYEFKQRGTPGLSSVQYTDGSISKFQVSEFLAEVESILKKYRKIVLFETT